MLAKCLSGFDLYLIGHFNLYHLDSLESFLEISAKRMVGYKVILVVFVFKCDQSKVEMN